MDKFSRSIQIGLLCHSYEQRFQWLHYFFSRIQPLGALGEEGGGGVPRQWLWVFICLDQCHSRTHSQATSFRCCPAIERSAFTTSTNEIEGFIVQVHVGGLPETFTSREKKQVLHLPETVASPNFVGCMKNVSAFTSVYGDKCTIKSVTI